MKVFPGRVNSILSLINLLEKRLPVTNLFLAIVMISPTALIHSQSDPPPTDPFLSTPAQLVDAEAPEYSGCGGQAPSPVNSAFEQQIVALVNAERSSRGLPPLKRVATLDQAARYHAKDMQQDGYFDHDTYDRVNSQLSMTCSMGSRLTSFYPNWSWLGENIASGYSTPQSVMAVWMGSPGHQQNILHTEFREIGIGYYTGNYWVQDFGRQNNGYPLVINNEAAETSTSEVNLYVYNRSTTAGWTEMRLRNDSLTWTSWIPYQTSLQWDLPNTIGEHTVTVEMRRGTITASSSDSIYLNKVDAGELGNLPERLTFTYSIADHRFIPNVFNLLPLNVGGESTLNWSITTSGSWFDVSPDNGSSPGEINVIPEGNYSDPGSTYDGSMIVAVTSPDEVDGSPHQIALTLKVVAGPIEEVYLPLLANDQ